MKNRFHVLQSHPVDKRNLLGVPSVELQTRGVLLVARALEINGDIVCF